MTKRLLEIDDCFVCSNYGVILSDDSALCIIANRAIPQQEDDDYLPIPDWCPLPKADKEE